MNSWYAAPAKILVADDDPDLLALIAFALHSAGYETVSAADGSVALQEFARERFSLLVLNINMPAPNGLEVCTAVRRHSNVPILMLSARDCELDLLQALAAGADAYIVKPFSPRALIVRIHALLRRATSDETPEIQSGRFKLDSDDSILRHSAGEIALTKLETRVLRLLVLNTGQIVSASQLVAEVWSAYSAANRNMLKQVIFRLRRKLASNQAAFSALKTYPGGYMWQETISDESEQVHA